MATDGVSARCGVSTRKDGGAEVLLREASTSFYSQGSASNGV
jgi:hypothetical protein